MSVRGMVEALSRLKKLRKLQLSQLWVGDNDVCGAATSVMQLLHISLVGGCEIEFGCNLESVSMVRTLSAVAEAGEAMNSIRFHVPDESARHVMAA